ncbi:DUF4147 domain-containing protein [Cellulomonas sp. H30R-01]|uniref:glycerate kinase type-2 family protein n=1 Tax=Cellulomonas sp. H30R-01 TaxID=2704467 RepID=UPI00138D7778|nr:DUF4147 domain-containing protein [Cellulomonas sp. H30R-01]QHT57563.1 DUF4147 domain-containing protein [Cellulomonas sp. H30R-01]
MTTTLEGAVGRVLDSRTAVRSLVAAGLDAADPRAATARHLRLDGHVLTVGGRRLDLARCDRVLVVGAGKATARLVAGIEDVLGDAVTDGLVVLRPADAHVGLRRVRTVVADHPVPSGASETAARALLALAATVGRRDLVLGAFTGGSSALVSAPPPGVTAAAKQHLHRLLLASGARIQDVNAVRKSVSAIKGGRLLAAGAAATWVNLTVSDVVGDDPAYLTDPTYPDPDGPAVARHVLDRLGLWDAVDPSVRRHLAAAPEPPDLSATDLTTVTVTSGEDALRAMVRRAHELGLEPVTLDPLEGEATQVGARLATAAADHARAAAASGRPVVLLAAGGETTVSLGGVTMTAGTGGPNQEAALAFARALPVGADVVAAFVDSDGFDGPTEHAGALVDAGTVDRASQGGHDVDAALADHASTAVLRTAGDLLTTGATGTNVNDLVVVVCGAGSLA